MNKVLIVDDSAFMRGVLKELLAQRTPAVEIFEADGRSAAAEIFKKVQPDLVLLDVVMRENELEGVEVLKDIKESYPNTKVIMLTSVGQVAVIEECKTLGAESYLEKPFDRDTVLDTIDKYLI
jgi:two-component system chemotaxis response regulator CheY